MSDQSRLRVLVAARAHDLSDTPYDGFITRHRLLLDALASRHDVEVAVMRPRGDDGPVGAAVEPLVIHDHAVADGPQTRTARVRELVDLARCRDTTNGSLAPLLARISASPPDVVVTVGPWLNREYAPLFAAYPAVHLAEEDLMQMPELAPQSRQARAFRRALTLAERRAIPQPTTVVVISDAEAPAARRRYHRATVETVPYTLPADDWPLAPGPSEGDVVLAVGKFTEDRQAEGLRLALDALAESRPDDLRVRLVSGAGLHPCLREVAELPWVELAAFERDLHRAYREARLVIVPALRATGMKTTILQGWASGCAVVTYAASAATVGRFPHAMCVAEDGQRFAEHVVRLWGDATERRLVAENGLRVMHDHFDPLATQQRFLDLVAAAARAGAA